MSFSMSTRRDGRLGAKTGAQPVTVWGSDADGGEDGLPVVVARGSVRVHRDGPELCTVTTPEGVMFEAAETSWAPLRGEWTIEARRIDPAPGSPGE
jgi:hypothetical protein